MACGMSAHMYRRIMNLHYRRPGLQDYEQLRAGSVAVRRVSVVSDLGTRWTPGHMRCLTRRNLAKCTLGAFACILYRVAECTKVATVTKCKNKI